MASSLVAMPEWVVHCEVTQRHVRRSQPTRDAALLDVGDLHHLAPLFGLFGDEFTEVGG